MYCCAPPATSLPFSEDANRSHTSDSQPKQKNAEKQSKDCTRKTVNKIDQSGFLLRSSLKQNRSDAAYERIGGQGKYCSAQDRQNGVRHFEKGPRHWNTQATSKKRSPVGSGKSDKAHDLTHQTQSPTANDFE